MHQTKFTFTGEKKIVDGKTVQQIQANRNINNQFGVVKKGELGGWIEDENCILWSGNAWVFPDCTVFGRGTNVFGNDNTKGHQFYPPVNTSIHIRPYDIIWWGDTYDNATIKVGCQTHSLEDWKKNFENIARKNGFPRNKIPEFLGHLAKIEKKFVTTPKTNSEKLAEVISIATKLQEKFSKSLVEDAKKLLESLTEPVAEVPAVSKGPLRDASGRFMKKD
jgi:hypothetical protein